MPTYNVSANSLSCLLDERAGVEVYPEPFRLQPTLVFSVPYSAYRDYLLSLKDDAMIRLSGKIPFLRNLASSSNPQLYKYFLRDIAFAICKEISFAEREKTDASIILPSTIDGSQILASSCKDIMLSAGQYEVSLREKISTAGFAFPKRLRAHNEALYKVAVYLHWISQLGTLNNEVGFVWDL